MLKLTSDIAAPPDRTPLKRAIPGTSSTMGRGADHPAVDPNTYRPPPYIGFGGNSKPMPDLPHVEDLLDLIDRQLADPDRVGQLGRRITGRETEIRPELPRLPGNVPIYISDCRRLYRRTDWRPRRAARWAEIP